jgi:two-component system response regulator AtoC
MVTGYATVENAVQAMKDGAYDFIQKPFDLEELVVLVEKALEKSEMKTLIALYESSRAIFSSLKLEDLFPIMIQLLKKSYRG